MENHPVIQDARAQGYTGEARDFEALADFLEARSGQAQVALALEQCVEFRPTSVELRLRLARLYRGMGNLELALPHLYHVFELNPEDRVAVEYLLWTAIECGRPDVASDVKESYPDNRYDGLTDELQQRIHQERENSTLRFSLAWMLYRSGQLAACRRMFQELSEDTRWGTWSVVTLGLCELKDNPQSAAEHFRRALESLGNGPRGDYLEVHYHMAHAQLLLGHYEEGLQNCYRLRNEDPGFPHLAELIGLLRHRGYGGGDSRGGGPPRSPQPSPLTPNPPPGRLQNRRGFPPQG